jgi:hypothetical protein
MRLGVYPLVDQVLDKGRFSTRVLMPEFLTQHLRVSEQLAG